MGAAVIVRKRLLPLLLVYRRPGLTEAGHVRFWHKADIPGFSPFGGKADIGGTEIPQRSDLPPHRLMAAKEIGSAYQDSEHFRSLPRTVTTSLWQLSVGLTVWADLAAVLLVGAHSTEEAPC